jgi:hypothetical protein
MLQKGAFARRMHDAHQAAMPDFRSIGPHHDRIIGRFLGVIDLDDPAGIGLGHHRAKRAAVSLMRAFLRCSPQWHRRDRDELGQAGAHYVGQFGQEHAYVKKAARSVVHDGAKVVHDGQLVDGGRIGRLQQWIGRDFGKSAHKSPTWSLMYFLLSLSSSRVASVIRST